MHTGGASLCKTGIVGANYFRIRLFDLSNGFGTRSTSGFLKPSSSEAWDSLICALRSKLRRNAFFSPLWEHTMTLPALKIFVETLKTSPGEIATISLHYKIRVQANSSLSCTWENGTEHLTSFPFLFCSCKHHCSEHPSISIFLNI